MALSRRLGAIAILSSCFFVAVACGDDDSKNTTGDAGAGGEGEGGDGNDSGGSKNTAGKAGSSAGTAGKTNGGTAGSGGTSGNGGAISEAGNGGGAEEPVAGAAGDGGTGPGGGGEGGVGGANAAGAGGEGGAPVVVTDEARSCSYDCLVDNDCAIPRPDLPPDTSKKCNPETKKCEDADKLCAKKSDCVPSGGFWDRNCQNDDGCFQGEACAAWDGVGWCASVPDGDGLCFPSGNPEALPHVGASGTVDVCVSHTWICGEQQGKIECFPGCEEFGCGDGNGDSCNPETGLCECETSAECNGKACIDGHCAKCTTSQDCAPNAQVTGNDICVNGTCGCSSAAKCPNPGLTNATTVCE